MSVNEAELAMRKAREEAHFAKANRDAELKAVHKKWKPEIERTGKAACQADYELAKAKEAAASHPWVGKIVRKMESKKISSSAYRSVYEKVEVRGVVEISGPSNPWNGRACIEPDHGTPVVRLLKKDGKAGTKHEILSRLTLNGDVMDWSIAEPA